MFSTVVAKIPQNYHWKHSNTVKLNMILNIPNRNCFHSDENIDSRLPIDYSKYIVYYSHQNIDSELPMYKLVR